MVFLYIVEYLEHKHFFEFLEKHDSRFGPWSKIRFLFIWRYVHWHLSDVCIIT